MILKRTKGLKCCLQLSTVVSWTVLCGRLNEDSIAVYLFLNGVHLLKWIAAEVQIKPFSYKQKVQHLCKFINKREKLRSLIHISSQRIAFNFAIWEWVKLLYFSLIHYDSWKLLTQFDVQVNFPVEFCNRLFSFTTSWNFFKGGTSSFLLLIKPREIGPKTRHLF